MDRAVLGVERSLGGRRWRERLEAGAAAQAVAIGQAHGLPDVLARVLAGRGQTAGSAAAFLNPRMREALPDPAVLRGMGEAVERLVRAVRDGEAVAVFGDYDVDGACSAALLAGYLRAAGLRPAVHIPDRLTEGYGPNVPAIEALARGGATLLVTVDCGTTSFEPLAAARAAGLDVVVVDHHGAGEALPPAAAVVNPNRQDDLSGLGHLCAAGVLFLVLVALHRALRESGFWNGRSPPDLLAALDLVALATVADVVPLTGLNRAFVAQGLMVMRQRRRPGLAALADVAGTDGPPTAFHLGFLLGPRINAGGRIGDAGLGTRLLLEEDASLARTVAEQLDALNRERRGVEAAAVAEAEACAMAWLGGPEDGGGALVTAQDGWHPGVVGLVAARLRERHGRPAFAVALRDGRGTGSGRSIPGVDLGALVREAVEAGLLLKGGGHAMAAGLTLEAGKLQAFRAFLDARCAEAVAAARAGASLLVDAALANLGAGLDMVEALARGAPYGTGNPEPVVAVAGHRVTDVTPVGADHLRLRGVAPDGSRLDAIAFRAAETALGSGLLAARGEVLHLAGTLIANHRGGAGRAELRLLDAARPQTS